MATAEKDNLRFGTGVQHLDIDNAEHTDSAGADVRQQEARRHILFFEIYFALCGIPLPTSARCTYLFQWLGFLAQLAMAYIAFTSFRTRIVILFILRQWLPMLFLFLLTRSKEWHDVERIIKHPIPWWIVAVQITVICLLAVGVALNLGDSSADTSIIIFFMIFVGDLPISLATVLCLAYVEDMGKPHIESLNALVRNVTAFEAANKMKPIMINILFVVPNIALRIVWIFIYLWPTLNNDDDSTGFLGANIFGALLQLFIIFTMLLPGAYYTANMQAFVDEMNTRYSQAGGVEAQLPLSWLNRRELGYKVFGVLISPALIESAAASIVTFFIAMATQNLSI